MRPRNTTQTTRNSPQTPHKQHATHYHNNPITQSQHHTNERSFGGATFLRFRYLTLVPIQTKMIEPALLSPEEAAWLDAYHSAVWDAVSPRLAGKDAALAWLRANTRPLAEQVAARGAKAA